jgi:ferredoxin
MSKPIVNQETCIGCGTCESICPAVFKIDGSGKSQVQEADYEANKEQIQEAIDACPVNAISWGE